MEIRFWGVRGSIASPGPHTAEVGGNTSCVEIVCGSTRLILDAGTGLRGLGDELMRRGETEATLLLSHHHWDHIQGLPFFVPLYVPGSKLTIAGACVEGHSLGATLEAQMRAPNFPVRFDEVPSDVCLREVRPGASFEVGDVRIKTAKLNHPGGVTSYRIEHEGRSVVYATDTEHYACVDPALNTLAQGADVLIYDAQYTPEEYRGEDGPSRVGWGHSTFAAGARAAEAAGVDKLVLFHHDPKRTDDQVKEIVARSKTLFVDTLAAREGGTIALPPAACAA